MDLNSVPCSLCQASDNTRHLARNQKTGEAYLVQPEQMRRVVLCSGSIYYHLSHARHATVFHMLLNIDADLSLAV